VNRGAITAALAAALAVPLLAGCGEKEEPPTTGPVVAQTTTGPATTQTTTNGGNRGPVTDEEQAVATVKLFLTQPHDPSVCDELITPAFLKKAYGNRQGCAAARKPGALADRVTILARRPGPRDAIVVTVKPRGGVLAGQTLKVTVVPVGNAWKIDKVTSDVMVGP